MQGYILSASFKVDASSEQEAEAMFEDWLVEATQYQPYDEASIAFDCVEAVMAADSAYAPQSEDAPEAQLREAA